MNSSGFMTGRRAALKNVKIFNRDQQTGEEWDIQRWLRSDAGKRRTTTHAPSLCPEQVRAVGHQESAALVWAKKMKALKKNLLWSCLAAKAALLLCCCFLLHFGDKSYLGSIPCWGFLFTSVIQEGNKWHGILFCSVTATHFPFSPILHAAELSLCNISLCMDKTGAS